MNHEDDYGGYVAGLILNESPEGEEDHGFMATSLRLPTYDMCKVDAIASQAGKSRSEMLRLLIATGIKDVFSRLPHEVQEDLAEDTKQRFENLI